MCSAMPLRIAHRLLGPRASSSARRATTGAGLKRRCRCRVAGQAARERELPAVGPARGRLGGCGRRRRLGRRRASAAGWAWPPDSTKPRMSFLVTRPPRPVPGAGDVDAVLGRDPRDDRGDEALAVAVGARLGGCGCGCGCRGGWFGGRRLGLLRGGSLGARRSLALGGCLGGRGLGRGSSAAGAAPSLDSAGAAPGAPMTASRVPTSTVSPSWTRICCTTPVPGLGTSVSTLSVEISSTARPPGSPRLPA